MILPPVRLPPEHLTFSCFVLLPSCSAFHNCTLAVLTAAPLALDLSLLCTAYQHLIQSLHRWVGRAVRCECRVCWTFLLGRVGLGPQWCRFVFKTVQIHLAKHTPPHQAPPPISAHPSTNAFPTPRMVPSHPLQTFPFP